MDDGRNRAAYEEMLDEALEARRWRPIETAPKDETPILAWERDEPYIAHWDLDQWWTDDDRFNDSSRYFPPTCAPTHWMPLPDPPVT